MKLKILIVDHHSSSNRGDAAILYSITTALKQYFSTPEIVVMADFPESLAILDDIEAYKQTMVPFRWKNLKKNFAGLYLLLAGVLIKRNIFLPGIRFLIKRLSLEHYIDADIVVSTGGGFLNDFYAPANLGRLWGMYFSKILGKKIFIFAQSIGPFDHFLHRVCVKFVLNKVDLITLRDQRSMEILNSIGINKPPVYVTADAAFSMEVNGVISKVVNKIKKIIDPENFDLRISISVRKWQHYKYTSGHKNYIQSLASLADWLVLEKRAQIFFISTCTNFAGYHHDDRLVAEEIIDCMKCKTKRNPLVLFDEVVPQDLVEIYKFMDLHIGTRMHSNIFALLGGEPIVAIQYEFKTAELMETFELLDYSLDINTLGFRNLKTKVNGVIANQAKIRETIQKRLPDIKERSLRNAELLYEFLNKEGSKK